VLHRSTIQLLRFPFSLFLLPVFLFALSQLAQIDPLHAWVIFFVLHVLVYPASNGYNSYMDRDETPIGGLAQPLQPTKQLFYVTIAMDLLAIFISWAVIGWTFALGMIVYIAASRAYSYRGIRLKRFPLIGFLTVFIFQGAWIFVCITDAANNKAAFVVPALAASCLIGALYPLTQVYQHEADRADGVTTLSMLLGKRGSFVFSALLFLLATLLLYLHFSSLGHMNHFYRFLVLTLPVVGFFGYWMIRVWKDPGAADFQHSFLMNAVATICTTVYFFTLILSRS
jgi:1,4-dihydroxy-2-naphthoate octaprenyltransferase